MPQTEFTRQLLDVSLIQLNLELAQSDHSAWCLQTKSEGPTGIFGKVFFFPPEKSTSLFGVFGQRKFWAEQIVHFKQ